LTTHILYATGTLALAALCFWAGRRSRKYPLMNEDQARALRYFLYKEVYRHRLDIRRAKKDIRTLEREWGITGPAPGGLDAWIEARKGRA
jgi:hypothetical protein